MTNETVRLVSIEKPWTKYFPKGASEKPLPCCTLYGRLVSRVNEMNALDAYALYYYGTRIKYGVLLEKIKQYAAAFDYYGVKKRRLRISCYC